MDTTRRDAASREVDRPGLALNNATSRSLDKTTAGPARGGRLHRFGAIPNNTYNNDNNNDSNKTYVHVVVIIWFHLLSMDCHELSLAARTQTFGASPRAHEPSRASKRSRQQGTPGRSQAARQPRLELRQRQTNKSTNVINVHNVANARIK